VTGVRALTSAEHARAERAEAERAEAELEAERGERRQRIERIAAGPGGHSVVGSKSGTRKPQRRVPATSSAAAE
jgi:hypothetical protein